jgi:hypothetical protein
VAPDKIPSRPERLDASSSLISAMTTPTSTPRLALARVVLVGFLAVAVADVASTYARATRESAPGETFARMSADGRDVVVGFCTS